MQNMRLLLSRPHPCQYLSQNTAVMLFVDPACPMNSASFGWLCRRGFRRSGDLVYRPACPGCSACQAVRIPVERFVPRRTQLRCRGMNSDLVVEPGEALLGDQDLGLFFRYLSYRHQGGGMDGMSGDQLREFLECSWSDARFVRFYLEGGLCAVTVLDVLDDGLSAVYSFFAPELSRRGLGNFCILWSIDWARRLKKSWLYLGYWIGECRKMSYKAGFLPQQRLVGEAWMELGRAP